MPNIKSAKKRVRTSAKNNLRNRAIKSSLKTIIKKFDQAVSENNGDKASALLKEANSALDKAASKGTIHKNKADRKKAQLAKSLDALKAS